MPRPQLELSVNLPISGSVSNPVMLSGIQRAEMWRRIFPGETPTENLDPTKLSRLNIAGGNIRNIALNAAFLAAEAGEPVRMGHILSAARSEYDKIEKPLTSSEISGWQ